MKIKNKSNLKLSTFIEMENEKIPEDILKNIANEGDITKTSFADKNNILINKNLHLETGYTKMEEDYYLVSMYTPMPNVTAEMVNWWFWWHAQGSARYRAWYPKEHISISYSKKDREYFNQKTMPEFKANTQYPVERVGKLVAPLSIDFVDPMDFGFDKNAIEKNNIETIVCGHVSAFKGLIPNTEMAHIFVKADKGLLLVSRFWLGKNVTNKFLKKLLVTEKQAEEMAKHCCIEYRNFNKRISIMYNAVNKNK